MQTGALNCNEPTERPGRSLRMAGGLFEWRRISGMVA